MNVCRQNFDRGEFAGGGRVRPRGEFADGGLHRIESLADQWVRREDLRHCGAVALPMPFQIPHDRGWIVTRFGDSGDGNPVGFELEPVGEGHESEFRSYGPWVPAWCVAVNQLSASCQPGRV